MTIRRQYQLPNCSLVLDGLSIDPSPGSEDVMSLLVNAECRISGLERSLNGGYNFFAALVRAVSQYGQEVLSGFAHPQVIEGEPLLVHINPGDGPYHHLVVQPEIADLGETGDGRAIDIKLSAVQLFDLTEAVDQFYADKQTLPELAPGLAPLARRFVRSDEPMSDRAVPAIIGVGGLVVATMALGLLPVPELRDPALETREVIESTEVADIEDSEGEGTPPTDETDTSTTEITTIPLDAEAETAEAADETESAAESETEPDGEPSVIAEGTDEATDDSATSATEDASDEEVFENFDEFTGDGTNSTAVAAGAGAVSFEDEPPAASLGFEQVRVLNGTLKQTIVDNREQPRFGDAIIYRVRVSEDGTVLGYEPSGRSAVESIGETPLPQIVGTADDDANAVDYRVVFTERGVVEVSPWWGWSYYE